MDGKKIKMAFTKAFSLAAVCFSMSILFIGVSLSFSNAFIAPIILVKIFITFFILGIFTFFRILLDSSKWAMSKPFYVKDIIVMPLYLAVSLFTAMDISREVNEFPRFSLLLIYALLFLVVFTIRQLIEYFICKAKTDEMNDALTEFQKEHSLDEEE